MRSFHWRSQLDCEHQTVKEFLTRNPAAQKKSIFFGRATLQRRKNRRYVCRNAPSSNAQTKKQASRDGCLLFDVGLPPAG